MAVGKEAIQYAKIVLKNLCANQEETINLICPFGWNLYDAFPNIGERLSGRVVKERICELSKIYAEDIQEEDMTIEGLEHVEDNLMYEVKA